MNDAERWLLGITCVMATTGAVTDVLWWVAVLTGTLPIHCVLGG